MKEELQGKLVEILTSMQTAAGKASDFAMEQLPDIAQSYVVYGRISLSVAMAVALLLAVAALALVLLGVGRDMEGDRAFAQAKADNKSALESETDRIAAIEIKYAGIYREKFVDGVSFRFAAAVVSVPAFCGLAVVSSPFFMVWFAPKVWLLKEIAGMLK